MAKESVAFTSPDILTLNQSGASSSSLRLVSATGGRYGLSSRALTFQNFPNKFFLIFNLITWHQFGLIFFTFFVFKTSKVHFYRVYDTQTGMIKIK